VSAPVFLSDGAATARPGDEVVVTGPEAHHAFVQRLGQGDRVDLVDGRGARASGAVIEASTERLLVRVDSTSFDDDPEVVLVQALAKAGRDEQAIEAATELGATRIVPWAAARCVVEWRGAKAHKARASWEDRVLAAAKQSRRARVPVVGGLVTTTQLAAAVAAAVSRGARVVVLHEAAGEPLAFSPVKGEPLAPLWFVVGPEGGIADAELATLVAAGAVAVRLGPYVLRASSAGPAAIAAAAALRGAWTSAAAPRGPWANAAAPRGTPAPAPGSL
jgi:16S rRNA (uracil1498-N3)-methyltransferase